MVRKNANRRILEESPGKMSLAVNEMPAKCSLDITICTQKSGGNVSITLDPDNL